VGTRAGVGDGAAAEEAAAAWEDGLAPGANGRQPEAADERAGDDGQHEQ